MKQANHQVQGQLRKSSKTTSEIKTYKNRPGDRTQWCSVCLMHKPYIQSPELYGTQYNYNCSCCNNKYSDNNYKYYWYLLRILQQCHFSQSLSGKILLSGVCKHATKMNSGDLSLFGKSRMIASLCQLAFASRQMLALEGCF